jgi:3D (Asp-Asp-Asp) domain-containing protein
MKTLPATSSGCRFIRTPALRLPFILTLCASAASCATAGSRWIAEPLANEGWDGEAPEPSLSPEAEPHTAPRQKALASHVISEGSPSAHTEATSDGESGVASTLSARGAAGVALGGRSLGTFRNTYYDFPSENDYDGATVPLKNARCETISQVPRGFFESVCVQGSGTLSSGATVSFAKRDCSCAENCPRTDQRICFDVLDSKSFPWGRGATGKAITPLVTVAVDSEVIPLGTPLYVPELDGIARDPNGTAVHDGCFVAQDRGVRVKGKHLDIFTGHASVTALWNRLMPSNQGVTVILDSPRCKRVD